MPEGFTREKIVAALEELGRRLEQRDSSAPGLRHHGPQSVIR